ncbi:MAG TPA: hypothetical protein VMU99_08735 [Acidimicrobiales bacterium]|nr:hypothetical protein [Acidimicrobiales bacterium]
MTRSAGHQLFIFPPGFILMRLEASRFSDPVVRYRTTNREI